MPTTMLITAALPVGRRVSFQRDRRHAYRTLTRTQAHSNGVAQSNGLAHDADISRDSFLRRNEQEKFWSLEDLLSEARAEGGDDLIFEDNSEDPVWELEHRIQADPIPAELIPELTDFTLEGHLQQQLEALDPVPNAYSPDEGFEELSVEDLAARRVVRSVAQALGHDSVPLMVLDVRDATDFAAGHVPGALSLPFAELSSAVKDGDLDAWKQVPLAVICASGSQSAQACVRLAKVYGFAHPINVKGGISAWQEAGLPLETGH